MTASVDRSLTRPSTEIRFAAPDLDEADEAAVLRVLRSGWITTGDECAALEAELSTFSGADHVVAFSSCTAALQASLAYLRLPRGSRVGVPTWTFAATALVVHHAGLEPVLLDVEPDALNLDPQALAADVDGLDAVIGVHFGGIPMRPEIRALCSDRGVPMIEDAAHALGATDDRGHVRGEGCAAAAFSFYATKNLTCAEGGALATSDPGLAAFARMYRQHGLSREAWNRYAVAGELLYDVVVPGIKGNLPDLLAALARSQLSRFGALQLRRRQLVDRYRANLADVAGLDIRPSKADGGSADHLFVVQLPAGVDRRQVVGALQREGIGTSVHFTPLHRLSWFADAAIGRAGVQVAERLADRVLSLPLHPGLSEADVDRVCAELASAIR